MSSWFFIIFFFIIVANIIGSVKKKAARSTPKSWSGTKSNIKQNPSPKTPWKANASKRETNQEERWRMNDEAKAASGSFSQSQIAKAAARRLKDRLDSQATNARDIADKNRHRSSNWGERAGPGFFTLSNMFVVLLLGLLVLYILSIIPADIGSR